MRRFYGFIVLVVSLILVSVCSIQTQIRNLNAGLEYDGGYETVYKVTLPGEKNPEKEIVNIANTVVERIEDAEVENAQVEYEKSSITSDESEYYIRIKMNANSEDDLDYVLRSVEASGKITVSTLMNTGEYDYEMDEPFEIGSAEVDWTSSTPYVSVDVKDGKEFKKFIEYCNEAYSEFQDTYNSSSSDDDSSSVSGVMVIWLDKEETDSYVEAFNSTDERAQAIMRNKVLAIVPTDNFYYEEDSNGDIQDPRLLISYYDFDQTAMNSSSAHTIERIINYGVSDFTLTRLYTNHIDATQGENYATYIMYGVFGASLLLLVYFVIRYGLAGLAGWSGLLVSLLVQVIVFNFFSYTFTSMVAVALGVSLLISAAFIIAYLEKFKDELYKGKTPSKANKEARRGTLVNVIDITLLILFVTIISVFCVSSQVKLLPSTLIIGSICSLIFNRLITSFSMYWLTNNSLANTNKKIFRVKEKDIPDVMNQEEQTHFNPLHNFDAKKHGKKTFIGSLIATCVCVLSIVVLAFIPSVSIFNASEESNQYTRIEINSELVKNHYIFETNDSVISFFEEKYPDMKIADVSIKVEEEVILEDDDREYRPDIVYVSIKLDDKLANDYISSIQESLVTDLKALPNVDTDHLYVTFTTCESASVDYLLNSAIIFISLVAGLTLVFVTIRFGYTYGLATLATLIPASCISLGFYALTRIEISALSLAGIAGGLLIISISQMVLFERMKRLKRESRYKITTYEEREAIALKASKDTMFTVISILATAMVIVVVLALASPLKYAMISTYGILLLTIVIGGINTIFLLIPTYLFLEKRIHWSWSFDQEKRNKKRMEKAKEQNKNRGAEPREAIIPGIND